MNDSMLTTFDNPFDYFEQFEEWNSFDQAKNYNTLSLIDRIATTSSALSDEENAKEIDRAIDQILLYDYEGIYKKVNRPSN